MTQPQQPAIPVQQTIKSTQRAICKLNGDDLPKLRRVKRPELSGQIALYNTFTKRVLNTTLNCWFKQHANVMDNLEKQQAHAYKSMCRMQRLKRRVQKDEHERRREEIRRLFKRQRKKQLIRNVVRKFKENVIRKRQERLEEVELSQGGEENSMLPKSIAKFTNSFRRMTEPNVGTHVQQEPEGDNSRHAKPQKTETTTSALQPPTTTSGSLVDSEIQESNNHASSNAEISSVSTNGAGPAISVAQKPPKKLGQKPNANLSDGSGRTKPARRRKEALHAIPEVETLAENDREDARAKTTRSPRHFVKSPSTKSLPSDLTKLTLNDPASNRRGSLPSKRKQADCVSADSKLVNPIVSLKNSKDDRSLPHFSSSQSEFEDERRDAHYCNQDQAIRSVEQANASPDHMKAQHSYSTKSQTQPTTEHGDTSQFEHPHDFPRRKESGFSHNSFYSSTPCQQNHYETTEEALSQSANAGMRHRQYNHDGSHGDSTGPRNESQSPHSQFIGQNAADEPGPKQKTRKKNLVKQIKAERVLREQQRSDALDSEPFTRYTRRGGATVTPMHGLPKRVEFNAPTRKLDHEHGKMLRGVQGAELQNQLKIDHFFKDLFQPKDRKVQPMKKPDDDKPKKPALTLAGVLSQLYTTKDSSSINKNSLEWLKKCQYLRVYNPSARTDDEDGSSGKKTSSWDVAERKLKSGFLALMRNG